MYTPKDLKNEGQHIFFKLLSFVIYSNLLYVVLLFLTVMIYARITGEYSSVESIINQLDTRFFTIYYHIFSNCAILPYILQKLCILAVMPTHRVFVYVNLVFFQFHIVQ